MKDVRIVSDGPYNTTITSGDESIERVSAVRIDYDWSKQKFGAQFDVLFPRFDITVEEAEVRHVCPFCGHTEVQA